MKSIPLDKPIKHNGKENAELVLTLLKAFGVNTYEGDSPSDWANRKAHQYSYLIASNRKRSPYYVAGGGKSCGDMDYYNMPEDLAALMAHLTGVGRTQVVSGVGTHKAVLTLDGIKVGCTNVSWDKFDEIVAAAKKVRD